MIVKMKHLDLLCLAGEKDATLEALRAAGAVHLDLSAASGAGVAAAKGDAADAEKAVRFVLKARGKSKPATLVRRDAADVLALQSGINAAKTERDETEREISRVAPFGDFDPALAAKLVSAGIDIRAVADFPDPLPAKSLSALSAESAALADAIAAKESALAETDDAALTALHPELADRIAFAAAREIMEEQGVVAVVSGWLPAPKADELRSLAAKNGWGVLLRDPADGEIPPTLVEPPKAFRPMTALFGGLGIAPAYTESDVSVPFMCYFSLFFAMLVGDGAYGAIFLAGTLLARKKLPKAWFILMTAFSVSTVAWGVLSNTWFGAGLPWCRDWPTVKWLADATYHNMMLLCFTIGVSHLMLARIWNGVCRFPDSTSLAEFGWAGILLFMYLVTNSIVGIFGGIPSWGFWTFGVSMALVVLFSVKPSELKTRGAELGMLPLTVMSSLGDIISYVRLFAVGLASVKVAENFNSMATGMVAGDKALWAKALLSVAMVAVLLVGHGLNLAMAGLSVLVHAVRLNTLEFSNHKGVSWSGVAFHPFRKVAR